MASPPDPKLLLQRALAEVKDARARLVAAERARSEPIALVGVGCRLPGDVDGPEALWDRLREGVDCTGEVPPGRWDPEAFYDPDPDAPGKASVRRGGFLREVDRFAARFFRISPREAAWMDPQHRLLLEVAWEALEDAGIAADRLRGGRVGVFVGITNNDYAHLHGAAAATGEGGLFHVSGSAFSFAAGRLAFVLGAHGPAVAIDTACSSSLVALHLACQSLRAGECDLALVGGVNLILAPGGLVVLSKARMLAPDGRCKTFDAAADGYARGEGCGVVVLRRLRDAEAAGDRIVALVRGTAVNQDGASSGLTVPNGAAQRALI
ncbi:MAG: polyketide synthase [Nannocystaceae bacterium]